jgi:PAS domain S-box-containing protein
LRATFERAVIGIAHVSPEGRLLRVNQRLGDLLGYRPAELAALTAQDLTHPDDRDAALTQARHLLAGAIEEYELDTRFIRKDGTPVWVHLAVVLVRTPAGEPDYFITMAHDITARKRLEEERAHALEGERATNARMRALQTLTDTALSYLALDDLLRELLGRVTAVMGVDQVAILLLDEDGRTLTLRAARGLLEEAVGQTRLAVGQGFPGRIAASRMPLIVNALSAADYDGAPPIVRERLHSAVGVPLLVEDLVADVAEGQMVSRLVGVVHVGSCTSRHFTAADVQLLQRAADRIALAIDRARLYAAEQEVRQRAEAALARAEASEAQVTERAERLHTILETMSDGVAVYDADGRPVQLVNQAYRVLFALERGPAGYDALPTFERARLLHVRDAATGAPLAFAGTPVGRALQGEMVTGPDADIRVRAFDGRELEVNSSAAPLRDGDGRVVGAVLVLRDMTERNRLAREREAARLLAERQADELDRAYEAAADGLTVWDAAGQLVRQNPAARRILGLDAAPPGFDQLPLTERLACYAARDEQDRPLLPEEWPFMRTLCAEVGTGPEARDIRLRALDGREVEVNNSAAPLQDREGHLVGAVCVLHDMTERNRLERERAAARADELAAREVSRRLEEFLATAAHDLRSPLTATVGFLALAERQIDKLTAATQEASPALVPQVAAVRGRLADADQSAERLTRLLTLLFDTAAIHADRLELHRASFDLVALVREQVAALRVAAPGRTIRLHASATDAPIPVEVDADRIGQVLTNYVTNALKYSPPDRPVEVTVAVRGGWVRVAVCDQGPGLPKAEHARVWELLHRAPGIEVQSRMQGGSLGLGLHISKAIVEAHSGRVGVESTVGQGSTFWFTLPLAGPLSRLAGAVP